MKPTIESTGDSRLLLHDPIEGAHFDLLTDRPVTPTTVATDRIPFPIDRAATVEVGELVVPKLVSVTVRRPDGGFLSEHDPDGSEAVEHGDRLLDVSTAPLVLYLHVPGPVTFRTEDDTIRISLEGPREVVVGCRSFHERPAATVTVPPDPEAAMRAVSTFGSALKTTSSERSYPTLRGHPPRIDLGDELSIPDGVERPETDVRIEVPPELRYVFPVASLAYYLGAAVRPGTRPVLCAGDLTYPLDGPGGFERVAGRTLRRLFFLDAVVRTEGLYRVPLAERTALIERLDDPPDLAALYDANIPEQLETYLSLPTDVVDDLLPEWPLCVDLTPEPSNLEALPYLVDDLALLRCADPDSASGLTSYDVAAETRAGFEAAIDQFVRSDGSGSSIGGERNRVSEGAGDSVREETFRLPSAPAMEHAYIGPRCPLGVNKCSVSALRRRLDYTPAEEPGISVRIVCNDEAMADEDVVEEYYGLRELVQFDVTVDYGLTRRELKSILLGDVDFLHYVGHIDETGIACTDGKFDARRLDAVGVESFLLNACSSYQQGRALVDAGAQAGVVTTSSISNTVATAMGRTLARALNTGFTFRSALAIADEHHPTAYRYLVLGDGAAQLVQCRSGMPYSLSIEQVQRGVDDYQVGLRVFPASGYGPGATVSPHLDDADTYLAFGHIDTWSLSKEDLQEFIEGDIVPLSIHGELFWTDEFPEI